MSQPATSDIVITGIGVLSPIGIGVDTFQENIEGGKCGFRPSEIYSHVASPDSIGGEVVDFTEKTAKKEHLRSVRKQIKVMCREIQLGVASALQAMNHAGIEQGSMNPERIGVEFGANLMTSPPSVLMDATIACVQDADDFQYDKWGVNGEDRFKGMEPLWLLRYLPNMPGCHIGIAVDARGPNNSHTVDEASGGVTISEASNIIRRGRADVMIVGTTGTRIHPVKAGQHEKWDVLADGPADERCRPLDRNRSGEVLAEAACTLILESREHAEARGATIYGSVLSAAATCVASEKEAVELAARTALGRAGVAVGDLGHINVCASGHPERDAYEAAAIHSLVNGNSDVSVTALKSYLGSAGSGSALTELAGSLLSLKSGYIPKTLNFSATDEGTPLSVVSGDHQATDNRVFLKTSVTRVGQATAIVIGA